MLRLVASSSAPAGLLPPSACPRSPATPALGATRELGPCGRRGQPSRHRQRKMQRCAVNQDIAAWEAYDQQVEEERLETMKEYEALKEFLKGNCRLCGGLLTTYLLLTTSLEAALCTATGAAASYGYLLWIMHDVDQVTGDDPTPMRDVDEIKSLIPRRIARALLGLRLSVTPRLLVPISLGVGIALFNKYSGDHLTLTEEGSLVLGFLSYKLALFSKIYDDLRPRFGAGSKTRKQPVYREIDDDWDMYGRKKTQPVGVQEADRILAEEAERKGK